MHSERTRQWVHIGSGLFALLLRVLTAPQAILLAGVALVFNLFVLPRVGGRRLYRAVDESRGYPLGILLYPVSVILLIASFPSRLDIVAAAWAILAFGDGCATLIGSARAKRPDAEAGESVGSVNQHVVATTPRRTRRADAGVGVRAPLAWNPDKSVAGTTAFMICGGAAGAAFAMWVRPAVVPTPPIAFAIAAPIVAAVVAGLGE
jgi:dolichol kinase